MGVKSTIDAVEKHSNLVAERFIARISNDQIAIFDRGKRELKRNFRLRHIFTSPHIDTIIIRREWSYVNKLDGRRKGEAR